ncbi:hypothetical protein EV643_14712 [Kribbella sp. VKM Ac-2527]|uniref:Uncharacterized protein n=1 Tax=Kribbella caucasensis TaxID=2512215 RepID=A0A4R6J2X2_9ACTN|nr:hypothetical protein [Kribbella sp. VKM Ac-2527]TDO29623.1 hypothetical protein EV643_14712 [Kribbella sp. VKM Ac-2527]
MTRLWTEPTTTGMELFKRAQELPGFGEQKAQIFIALYAVVGRWARGSG